MVSEGKMWWPYAGAPKPNGGGGKTVVCAYAGAVVGKKKKGDGVVALGGRFGIDMGREGGIVANRRRRSRLEKILDPRIDRSDTTTLSGPR